MKKIKVEIKHRWAGSIMFEFESSKDNYPEALGETVRVAASLGAVLREADLVGVDLTGADLSGTDLRWVNLRDAVLRDADLAGAALLGADLSGADLTGANLSDAVLRYAVLTGADLGWVNLTGADLRWVNLREADLAGAALLGADLSGAVLREVDLAETDLSGAILNDCPVKIENIHQKVYQAASSDGALNMGVRHTYETANCRAGLVVHLAGEGGKALERFFGGEGRGTSVAAAMIYMASDPKLERIPDFCCSNEKALADMKRLAELEAADE